MISSCPSTQNANTDSGIATATVSWTPPTATDNSGTQTLTPDYNPGDSFPIGTTIVTYTSTDAAGNTDTCTFDIVVSGDFCFCCLLSPSKKFSVQKLIYQNAGFISTLLHDFSL